MKSTQLTLHHKTPRTEQKNKNHFTKDEHLENHPGFSPNVPAGINTAEQDRSGLMREVARAALWIKHNSF